jgi:hypothetical protein
MGRRRADACAALNVVTAACKAFLALALMGSRGCKRRGMMNLACAATLRRERRPSSMTLLRKLRVATTTCSSTSARDVSTRGRMKLSVNAAPRKAHTDAAATQKEQRSDQSASEKKVRRWGRMRVVVFSGPKTEQRREMSFSSARLTRAR